MRLCSFMITCRTVFVARQLVKHQIGLTWNEVSRRYVDDKLDFYHPLIWRGKADDKKQGSSDVEIDINPAVSPTGPTLVDVYQQAIRHVGGPMKSY